MVKPAYLVAGNDVESPACKSDETGGDLVGDGGASVANDLDGVDFGSGVNGIC